MNFKDIKPLEFNEEEWPKKREWPKWMQYVYWEILHPIHWFFAERILKLKKIWQYSVYLWKEDRDFDYVYILRLLELKLERMKNELKNYGHLASNDESIEQMTYVQKLINDYIEDNFVQAEIEELDKRFKQVDRWEDTGDGTGNQYWLMDYEENGVLHKDGSKRASEIGKMYLDVYELNRQRQEECKNELFYYMAEHMEGWWD